MYTNSLRANVDLQTLVSRDYVFNDESARQQLQIPDFAYYPTAPASQRAGDDFYLDLRRELLALAAVAQGLTEFDPSVREDRQLSTFDALLYPNILRLLPINLYEASKAEFWSYLTLRVVPDLANWRYKNSKLDLNYERHLGMPRNVFRRIWTRAFFSQSSSDLLPQMGEDQAVAIFERTSVVSNPKIAISSLKALAELRKITQNNEVYRDALKRVRRLKAIESLDVLTQDEVDAKVLEVFVQSLKAIAPDSVI